MDHKKHIESLEPLRKELAGLQQPSPHERSASTYVVTLQRLLTEAADANVQEAKLQAEADAAAEKALLALQAKKKPAAK